MTSPPQTQAVRTEETWKASKRSAEMLDDDDLALIADTPAPRPKGARPTSEELLRAPGGSLDSELVVAPNSTSSRALVKSSHMEKRPKVDGVWSTLPLRVGAKPSITSRLGRIAVSRVGSSLRVLDEGAGSSPLQPVIQELADCLTAAQASAVNYRTYDELALELQTMAGVLAEYVGELGANQPSHSAVCVRIALSIESELEHIKRQQSRSRVRSGMEFAEDKEDVQRVHRQISGLFRQLQNEIGLQTLKSTNEQRRAALLRELLPVGDAYYDSSYSTTIGRHGCATEMQEKLQDDLRDWIQDPGAARMFWMNGAASTGKTTVAYSLCEWFEANQRLGASFFCSHFSSLCRSVNLIVPTISYELARRYPLFRSTLCKVLEEDPDAGKLNVAQQLKKLVQKPILMNDHAIPDGVVVVIDALDECEDHRGVRLMVQTLLELCDDLPLVFFLASRPVSAIEETISLSSGCSVTEVQLHAVDEDHSPLENFHALAVLSPDSEYPTLLDSGPPEENEHVSPATWSLLPNVPISLQHHSNMPLETQHTGQQGVQNITSESSQLHVRGTRAHPSSHYCVRSRPSQKPFDWSSSTRKTDTRDDSIVRGNLDRGRQERNSLGIQNQTSQESPHPPLSPISGHNQDSGCTPGLNTATALPQNRGTQTANAHNPMITPASSSETGAKATFGTLIVRPNEMTTLEMFQSLVEHGCVDLTPSINPDKTSSGLIVGGSFGDIWQGKLRDGTDVAIKVWRFTSLTEDKTKRLKRAMREIYSWSKLNHQNVHRLLGITVFQGRLGMVSEWMKHGNLREYLQRNQGADRYELCFQVTSGLAHLHKNDWVHGDLKACNCLVSCHGIVKLADFDHMIMLDCSLRFSETSRVGGGTLRWMAPELVVTDTPPQRNKRTDVYALGMTMLEVITGKIPYEVECQSDIQIFRKLSTTSLPTRSEHFNKDEQGQNMWALLGRCWDYDPDLRPTAEAVLESIRWLQRMV